jgi:hypothetical protein
MPSLGRHSGHDHRGAYEAAARVQRSGGADDDAQNAERIGNVRARALTRVPGRESARACPGVCMARAAEGARLRLIAWSADPRTPEMKVCRF